MSEHIEYPDLGIQGLPDPEDNEVSVDKHHKNAEVAHSRPADTENQAADAVHKEPKEHHTQKEINEQEIKELATAAMTIWNEEMFNEFVRKHPGAVKTDMTKPYNIEC